MSKDFVVTANICGKKIDKTKHISYLQDFVGFTIPNLQNKVKGQRHNLLDDGRSEYLMTNLTQNQMSTEKFSALYQLRWGVERKYRELRNPLEIEDFNSVKPVNIRQEFFAAMYLSNLT